jgi:trichothecene 3-O-acetyltransferase
MDALFALFWHRSSIFRHLSGRGHENSSCRIPMDLRSRMQPPLDPNYIGNAVSMVATEYPVSELESLEGTSAALSTLAQKIRSAVISWDLSAFKAWVGTANSLHPDKAIRHPSGSAAEPNILMNDHSKLAVHNLDWGSGLGSLDSVRGLEPDFPVRGLAVCNFLPMFSDGGLEVATLFDNHVNEALAKDEAFMHYAELRYG